MGGFYGPGLSLGGNRAGFKEIVVLPMVGGDPMSKYHEGAINMDLDETAAEEHPLKQRTEYCMGSCEPSTIFSHDLSLHPFEETSPLGLMLKKSPSFIELIQMICSQGDSAAPLAVNGSSMKGRRKKKSKSVTGLSIGDKYKTSNFPASVLRIGSWESISRYEGDLVVKCYYAKRKLVWEVLEVGVKSKIEIHWSDITSLKASCPDNEPGTLEIEVSRCPFFFRETNPRPRNHTIWQATSDFTGGQASICRRHFSQFAEGILERYYEKLLQCDHRLNLLSKQDTMSGDSPYFDPSGAVFQDQNEHTYNGAAQEHKKLFPQFDHLKDSYLLPFSRFRNTGTSRVSPLVQKIEPLELDGRVWDAAPQDTPSSFAEKCSHNSVPTAEQTRQANKKILDDIAQHLLSDSLLSATFDEQKVIAHINTLGSIIEKDSHASINGVTESLENSGARCSPARPEKGEDAGQVYERNDDLREAVLNREDRINSQVNVMDDGYIDCKQSTGIARQDSCADLLVSIPRIEYFPQLFYSFF